MATTYNLIACVNVFEEAGLLPACLKALKPIVDKIVVVDGAYKEFPHNKPYSADGTIEIAKQYADVVIETKKAWYSEIVKRNRYLQELEINDYAIVVDADEVYEGGEIKDQLTSDDFQITLVRQDGIMPYPVYRIFRMRRGLQYKKTHATLFVDGAILNRKNSLPVLERCQLRHFTSERDNERKEAKSSYYEILTERERFITREIPE